MRIRVTTVAFSEFVRPLREEINHTHFRPSRLWSGLATGITFESFSSEPLAAQLSSRGWSADLICRYLAWQDSQQKLLPDSTEVLAVLKQKRVYYHRLFSDTERRTRRDQAARSLRERHRSVLVSIVAFVQRGTEARFGAHFYFESSVRPPVSGTTARALRNRSKQE